MLSSTMIQQRLISTSCRCGNDVANKFRTWRYPTLPFHHSITDPFLIDIAYIFISIKIDHHRSVNLEGTLQLIHLHVENFLFLPFLSTLPFMTIFQLTSIYLCDSLTHVEFRRARESKWTLSLTSRRPWTQKSSWVLLKVPCCLQVRDEQA